jgi:hypothetical protein
MRYKVFKRKGDVINDELLYDININETGEEFVKLMRKLFKFNFFNKIRIETRINVNNLTETTYIFKKHYSSKRNKLVICGVS